MSKVLTEAWVKRADDSSLSRLRARSQESGEDLLLYFQALYRQGRTGELLDYLEGFWNQIQSPYERWTIHSGIVPSDNVLESPYWQFQNLGSNLRRIIRDLREGKALTENKFISLLKLAQRIHSWPELKPKLDAIAQVNLDKRANDPKAIEFARSYPDFEEDLEKLDKQFTVYGEVLEMLQNAPDLTPPDEEDEDEEEFDTEYFEGDDPLFDAYSLMEMVGRDISMVQHEYWTLGYVKTGHLQPYRDWDYTHPDMYKIEDSLGNAIAQVSEYNPEVAAKAEELYRSV